MNMTYESQPEAVGVLLASRKWGQEERREKDHRTKTRDQRKSSPDGVYTTVFFGVGRYFDLTTTETLLLHTIHTLAANPANLTGWCYASQEYLADALNITPQTINELLQRLRDKGLLTRGPVHPTLKTIQHKLAHKALSRLKEVQTSIAGKRKSRGI